MNQGFGNFAAQARDATRPAARSRGSAFEDRAGQFHRFLDWDRLEPIRTASTSSTSCFPTRPYQYLPTGQSYPPPPGKEFPGVDDDGVWTRTPCFRSRPSSATCCRSATSTAWSARADAAGCAPPGLYDQALIVLTADHGISFRPGVSRRAARGAGAADVLGMPLFVKLPRQRRGAVDDRHATTADVLPTIADALGIRLRWPIDGRSLLGAPRPLSEPVVASIFPSREKVSMPFGDYVRVPRPGGGRHALQRGPRPGLGRRLRARRQLRSVRATRLGVARRALVRPASDAGASGRLPLGSPRRRLRPRLRGRRDRRGGRRGDSTLALSVNGVIQGVVPTYASGDEARFGGLVPPSAFRPGANDVRVYAIDGRPRGAEHYPHFAGWMNERSPSA